MSVGYNKSPKLTPTRTNFTSKAAAAQLSSPLKICIEFICISNNIYSKGELKAWPHYSKLHLRFRLEKQMQ